MLRVPPQRGDNYSAQQQLFLLFTRATNSSIPCGHTENMVKLPALQLEG